MLRISIIILSIIYFHVDCSWIDDLNLPDQLLQYHISTNEILRNKCINDASCDIDISSPRCFGYETNCELNNTLSTHLHLPKCQKGLNIKVKQHYYEQADFGYLRKRQIQHRVCQSDGPSYSELSCSDQLTHCFARNIWIDFSNLNAKTSKRYRDDVIKEGQIGGNCEVFNENILKNNLKQKGYITSWADELQYFKSNEEFEMSPKHCDITFEKPTIIMKLDAAVNMYHHFCDFINLYASLHLNQTFDQDIDIIWWDTHPDGFIDKLYGITWKAFSNHKPFELKELDGKRVCFRNVLMPLLARQISGLFYNTPLVDGCSGSALVKTFSEFILHRLKINPPKADLENVRVVILSRSTSYRRILNIVELLRSIGQLPNVTAKIVDYNERISFINQINTTSKADIFIGMHGAGLTHLLFLPDWAAIFEVYNCGDEACYYDLARLRGIKYYTWNKTKLDLIRADDEGKHPINGEKHKKFANYNVDVREFTSIVTKMVEYVRRHPQFVNSRRKTRREIQTQRQQEL